MSLRRKELNEEVIQSLMQKYLPLPGFELHSFTDGPNICLRDKNDLAFFENESKGVWSGHYFFESRGKTALTLAKSFLKEFCQEIQPNIIKGLTPLEKLGARWMSRQLGFKSYGVVQTIVGPCELFILTKEDWENKINE